MHGAGHATCGLFINQMLGAAPLADATEVLQEEVMEFVNTIASIVHLEVCRGEQGWPWGGQARRRALI